MKRDIRDEVEIEIAELTSEDAPAVAILPAAWREGFLMRKDEIAPRPIGMTASAFCANAS